VVVVGALVLFLGLTPPVQKAPPQAKTSVQPSPLARARDAFNARQYDQAIRLATEARADAESADTAAVIFALAHIERYRATLVDDDLTSARNALKTITTTHLAPADYSEYLVGVGESLYYEERYGAAAELFALALARGDSTSPAVRDRLFDWWAGALDQQAQIGPEGDRKTTYQRIVDRAEAESARDDRSASAAYWLAAASRGADDLERAWAAAMSGWVRAPAIGERGATLRADLDRLVTLAIIPERARKLLPTGDLQLVVDRLTGEWQAMKEKWGKYDRRPDGVSASSAADSPAPRPFRPCCARRCSSCP
jgi:hypothetical protein